MVAKWRFVLCTERIPELVHLFGAVSSPACSSFSLLKTAEDNSQRFSADVTSSVRENFYVDNCLKSLPSTEDAIAHVSDCTACYSKVIPD